MEELGYLLKRCPLFYGIREDEALYAFKVLRRLGKSVMRRENWFCGWGRP